MGGKILVAGASGRVGAHVLAELTARGYRTRALVREPARLKKGSTDEVFVADAREPARLAGACAGVSSVISAMGASLALGRTRAGATFQAVDLAANLNLLAEARAGGVRRFVYVSLYGAERLRGLGYVDAHEEFVAALASSGLEYAVVRPTGFFYVFGEIFKMAARGRVIIAGDGRARTNPVHERDVARACADALEPSAKELPVGGPAVYTRRGVAELAFEALGRPPKVSTLPVGLMRALVAPVRIFDRRLYDLLEFGLAVGTVDASAPPYGTRTLPEYFRQLAAGTAT